MELEEPISSAHHDDVLMDTDAGFYGFVQSLTETSGAPNPAEAQAEATVHVKAASTGGTAAMSAHQNGAPDGPLVAPRPPDSQAQPPVPTFHWPTAENGGACFGQESSPIGNSMGGAADRAEGAACAMSEGTAAQPYGPRRLGSLGSGDGDARHIGVLIHKVEAERDKNRVAQKAFRARKKERDAAKEAQLHDLSARLASLELEKRALVARNALLQRAVAATAVPATVAPPGSPGSAAEQPAPMRAQGKVGRVIRPCLGWDSNLGWGREDVLELTLGEAGTAVRLDRALLLQTALPDVPRAWKAIVNKLAALLPEAGKEPDGSAATMVKLLVAEVQAIVAFRATVAPESIKAWITQRMEDVPFAPEAPTRAMWKRIMESMALSAEQKAALLADRRDLLARFGELLQERRALQARLRAYTVAMLDGEGYGPVHGKMVGRYCELRTASQQLEANIQALHRSKCIFFCRCARQILQPLQCASFAVQAYPFLPDTLAVLGILAEEAGEPSIGQLMAADGTAFHPVKVEPDAQPAPSVTFQKAPALVPAL